MPLVGEKASEADNRASEAAKRVSDAAGRNSKEADRALDAAGRALAVWGHGMETKPIKMKKIETRPCGQRCVLNNFWAYPLI